MADSFALVFEVGDGKRVTNIYLFPKWHVYKDSSSRLPAPQQGVTAPIIQEKPLQGTANDCVLSILNRYRYKVNIGDGNSFVLPIFFVSGRK